MWSSCRTAPSPPNNQQKPSKQTPQTETRLSRRVLPVKMSGFPWAFLWGFPVCTFWASPKTPKTPLPLGQPAGLSLQRPRNDLDAQQPAKPQVIRWMPAIRKLNFAPPNATILIIWMMVVNHLLIFRPYFLGGWQPGVCP